MRKLEINRPIEDLSKEFQSINIQILPIVNKDIELYSAIPSPIFWNAHRLKPGATQTKPTYVGLKSIQAASAALVCIAAPFQGVGFWRRY
jgi:hypothetical protein